MRKGLCQAVRMPEWSVQDLSREDVFRMWIWLNYKILLSTRCHINWKVKMKTIFKHLSTIVGKCCLISIFIWFNACLSFNPRGGEGWNTTFSPLYSSNFQGVNNAPDLSEPFQESKLIFLKFPCSPNVLLLQSSH